MGLIKIKLDALQHCFSLNLKEHHQLSQVAVDDIVEGFQGILGR